MQDLTGGVSQIGLVIDDTGEHGIRLNSDEDWTLLLADIHLDIAPIHLEPGHNFDAAGFAKMLSDKGAKSAGLGIDARHADLAELAKDYAAFTIASVDARCVHEAGGTEAQELAYAASGFACGLGRMVESGINPEQAVQQVEIVFSADADIHLSISKLRAARQVIASIAAAYDADVMPEIRVVSSARMLTRQDPWTNMIRLTSAAFAAAAGGADTITILPPTQWLGRPDGLARRFSRNLHILLQEESRLGQVSDPAAGSYLHEQLSHSLAEAAWSIFQEQEDNGQFESIGRSHFSAAVASSAQALMAKYKSGDATLFGVNRHASADLREMRYEPGAPPPSSDADFGPIRLEDAALDGGRS
ncbi:methylmalonyl-CoA mutase family protein [Hyphobacterium sp.]|uniref:methylmalonyl-CoA mutase family protein n=1 Tax=Hyphobacterium sp. TaxID=2004662 RepID=UPI003BAB49B5